MTDTYSLRQTAIIGGSTLSLGLLAFGFGILCLNALTAVFSLEGEPLIIRAVLAIGFVMALFAFLLAITTGVLQVRQPKPRLMRLTLRTALAWPLTVMAGFSVLVIYGVAIDESYQNLDAIVIWGLFMLPFLVILLIIGLLLALPAVRNGLFRRDWSSEQKH